MKVLAINDSLNSLENITELIKSVEPSASVSVFSSTEESIAFARNNDIDILILNALNGTVSGIDIARRISNGHPPINIIFYNSGTALMKEAFALRASGYIVGAVTIEKLKNEFTNLRYAV